MKVVSSKQMAKLESKAISNGSVDAEFMEEAGKQIARVVHAFVERNDLQKQVVLLCGKGNNAGDAYVAGTHLLKMGYLVDAMQLYPFKNCSELCQINQTNFFNAGGLVREISSISEFALPLNGVIIDGIFGTGFKGKVEEPIATIIFQANASKLPIISIDIPSGLNGDTGGASEQTIQATETAFLGLPKLGFFLKSGWNCVGILRYVDFGLPFKYISQTKTDFFLTEVSMVKSLMPKIVRDRNKYTAGEVISLAGSPGMSGAAILSSLAALRSGTGIVKLLHNKEMASDLLNAPYELVKLEILEKDIPTILTAMNHAAAVLIGPGIGKDKGTCQLLKKLLPKIEKPCVLDADALNILSENKIALPKNCILTPHKQEMERLLQKKSKQPVDLPFIKACQEYTNEMNVTLILKGGPTFIFHPGEPIYINVTGDPGMATAGSGDVLSGLLVSLLAQGLSCHEAALLGTFLHGLAGEMAAHEKTSYCMIASDIINHFAEAFKALLLEI